MKKLILNAFIFSYFLAHLWAEENQSSLDILLLGKYAMDTKVGIENLRFDDSENKTTCFTGSLLTAGDNIGYEIFPDLGILRVRVLIGDPSRTHTWVAFNKVKAPMIIHDKKSDTWTLSESAKVVILAIGSGLLEQDLASAELTCRQSLNYSIKRLSVRNPDFHLGKKVKVLVSKEDLENGCMYENGEQWVHFKVSDK